MDQFQIMTNEPTKNTHHSHTKRRSTNIRIDMIRQDTNHPDKHRRHHGWAICEVAGQHFEAQGPAPIYRMATLLWFQGHFGEKFEVWDDLSPFGNPGGLAMTGRVRNWARLVKGKPRFDKDAPFEADFTPGERELIAGWAGSVADIDSPRPAHGRTAASRPSDGSEHSRERDRITAAKSGAYTPEAA